MQNTRNLAKIGFSMISIISLLNSPQRDDALLRKANVDIDRALFPLLVALDLKGPLSVVEIADLVGRDHTTISRQLTKLESLAFINRHPHHTDRRQRTAQITSKGEDIVQAITSARHQLLDMALADWSDEECNQFADKLAEFADALHIFAKKSAR